METMNNLFDMFDSKINMIIGYNMWNILRYAIFSELQIYVFHLVLKQIFVPKFVSQNLTISYCLILLNLIITYIFATHFNLLLIITVMILGLIIIYHIFYEGMFLTKAFIILIIASIMTCIEWIITSITPAGSPPNITSNMLLGTILYFLIPYIYKLKRDSPKFVSILVYIIIIPISSLIILLLLYDSQNDLLFSKPYTIFISTFILIMNLTIFMGYDSIIKSQAQKYEIILSQQQEQYYLNLYDIAQKKHIQISQLKHNIKFHLMSIKENLSQGNVSQTLNEINEYLSIVYNSSIFTCGVPIIDAVINDALLQIQDTNIVINKNIILSSEPKISNAYLANILGNILNNAIECCKRNNLEQNKQINLVISEQNCTMNILIRNSYEDSITLKDGMPLSTKRDKAQHGIGLTTVKNIVEKLNGIYHISSSNQEFIVNITLFNAFDQ
ncbi:MAG: hypothetical protein ATN31_11370 [Candidatus Epulonipiscioides saccharophilum]|nr:MAG: hypothetical protein ATN31_11370 [Epulopiscium sp. AS2M-Bin001]